MKNESQQLMIILGIVFIGYLGSSIAYPIFPPLFLHPSQGSIIPAHWNNDARNIFLGIALAAYPLGQFIGSPVLGGCSDHYGRKNLLMFSLFGSAIGYLLSALALQWNGLWLLLISRFLTGIMEGNFSIVRAMAVDLQSINKFKSLGRINAVASIGYVMGPLLGGFLSDDHLLPWFSFAFPFYLATFFSAITVLLAAIMLTEKKTVFTETAITIWQRFNFIARFRWLCRNNAALKQLLIVSTIFTFAVDIYYEFGPVYLTGLWSMTPAGIAVYNAVLSCSLIIGSGWLPHYLSRYFPVEHIMVTMMLITALIFAALVLFPTPLFAFLLFGLVGLSIAVCNTNLTIQISNVADKGAQGETLGAQISLRTLGDTVICLVGGFLIISSVTLPITLSCLVALMAVGKYVIKRK